MKTNFRDLFQNLIDAIIASKSNSESIFDIYERLISTLSNSDLCQFISEYDDYIDDLTDDEFEELEEKLNMIGNMMDESYDKLKTPTIVRDTSKIGRNDLCKCNSGKKFKKCCIGVV